MGTSVTVGGNTYTVPAYNDTGWAQGTGNLSQLLIAVAAQIASTPAFMQTVSVSASPVTVVSGKTYLTTTSSVAITFNLPTPAVNTWLLVKDVSGLAGTNNMTLHRHGSESINGTAADYVIKGTNGFAIVVSDGTNWFVLLDAGRSVATNTTIPAGYIGEEISSAYSVVSFPTSANWGDATSITLTPGNWDVSHGTLASYNGATVTSVAIGVSSTSGNNAPSATGNGRSDSPGPTVNYNMGLTVVPIRFSVSTNTLVYAKIISIYTVAVPFTSGLLKAVRVGLGG